MSLELRGRVRRGEFELAIELDAGDGEVVAVLGPNGAGKSTVLRVVAGLQALDEGVLRLAGDVVDERAARILTPPQGRRVGVVFQNHRLFPHLRVIDNVAFGPRSRGASRAAARASAREWLARLGLDDLAGRRPAQLSGGQAQRVALARALAARPRTLLLDEPLAALDVQTRAEVQGELRAHLGAFGGSTLLVTHDPIEALLLARRIVVLERGRVAQAGSPADITTRPLTPYVARLVGLNLYPGRCARGVVSLDGGGELVASEAPEGAVLATLRPSTITVHAEAPSALSAQRLGRVLRQRQGGAAGANTWPATVAGLAPLGDRIRLSMHGPPDATVDVTAATVAELDLAPGRRVWLSAKTTDVTAYPAPVAG
ncbi:sulfate/molybdate ABC transporter ATP-binding protein [uncultured Jatrophihabitans sp.]|uniref:sulfate/molybdate ABC transporter ATP-binding protein n=1 Tax=uncultured Jatrophihabitans sp. TaxID=1610747 RepID=UPI0035CA7BD1